MTTPATLRRRFADGTPPDISTNPSLGSLSKNGEPIELVPASQLQKLSQKKNKKRQWLVFGLGGLFGLTIAAFFAQRHDVINFDGLVDVNFDSLLDVIPAGIVKDVRDITVF